MEYIEIIISFVIGVAVTGLLALVFSMKTKGILRLLINAAAGCAALLILSLFKVAPFALNPLSAFLAGFLGVPGIIAIYLIMTFL